jgi:hypothetical protein
MGVIATAHITLRIINKLYCNLSNNEIDRRKPWETDADFVPLKLQ